MMLYLFLISHDKAVDHDGCYGSAVIVASAEETARRIHPGLTFAYGQRWHEGRWQTQSRDGTWHNEETPSDTWPNPDDVHVVTLGPLTLMNYEEGAVVCAGVRR